MPSRPGLRLGNRRARGRGQPAGYSILLGDYLVDWLDERRADLRPNTWSNYHNTLKRYLPGKLRARRLIEISSRGLTDLYDRLARTGGLQGKPLSAATVKSFHAILHKALEDAVRMGLIHANPAARARVPRYDKTGRGDFQLRMWNVEQLAAFLEFTDRDETGPLWRFTALTGLGRSELLGLTWGDVDLPGRRVSTGRSLTRQSDGQLVLRRGLRRPRTIAIGDGSTAILQSQRRNQAARQGSPGWNDTTGFVFTTASGEPYNPDHVSQRFRALARESGQPIIRLQDLRNTHAALLLRAGVPFHLVMQRLGHGDPWRAMRNYGHLVPPSDTAAATLFDELLDAATHVPDGAT